MKEPNFPIDFVVSWVNGSDPVWRKKKNKYSGKIIPKDNDAFNAENRYREYGLFKFWFRSVEKNAPWVRNIYIVTDSQIPHFLNLNNHKINIVDHKEIISKEFLPTFDSNTIDLNIHKIKGLSEHFVYFNDDVFINRPLHKSDFFTATGYARDTIGQSIIMPIEMYDHNIVNNTMKINQLINKKELLKNQWKYFFDPRQGNKILLLNLLLSIFPRFTRIYDPHTACSLIKSDMDSAFDLMLEEFSLGFSTPFRTWNDYTIQFIRYFQIINNHERPRHISFGNTAKSDNPKRVERLLFRDKKTKILNVNDEIDATNSDLAEINHLFKAKFKNVSQFEK